MIQLSLNAAITRPSWFSSVSGRWSLLGVLCLFLIACTHEQQSVDGDEVDNTGIVRGSLLNQGEPDQAKDTELSLEEPAPEVPAVDDEQIVDDTELSTETETTTQIEVDDSSAPICLTEDISDEESINATRDDNCVVISNRLASVSFKTCADARLLHSGCTSQAGFPIYVSEFPPLPSRIHRGKIMVIGGTHGDELTSVSVVFRWINKLNQFHSGLYHWRIIPLMNPDGVLKKEATRTNLNGVDLNRNMPSADWDEKALLYWRHRTGEDARKYPGPSAASEPEVKWLIKEIDEFQPDAIISVHAPYGIVDFDALILNSAPKSLGKLRLNMLGTYPGSLGNYAGINRDIPVITLELPHAWEMPTPAESTKIWEDIVSWL
ncbi:MAG: M14 family zinc carboxypeptidase, partial [Pseudomonadota bacterium]